MTTFDRSCSRSAPTFSAELGRLHHSLPGFVSMSPLTFYQATQGQRDVLPQNNSMTVYNSGTGQLEFYDYNQWVPFMLSETTPASGDSVAYNTITGRWEPSPTTNPTIDSLRIYGSSTTALEVKRVYSDTGGSHATSTGSMDAVGVHSLTGASNVTYTITIDSSGTAEWSSATFTWTDATDTYTAVPVYSGTTDGRKVLAPIELSNGVFVLFTVGNYVAAETWTVTAIAADNQYLALRAEAINSPIVRTEGLFSSTGHTSTNYVYIYADDNSFDIAGYPAIVFDTPPTAKAGITWDGSAFYIHTDLVTDERISLVSGAGSSGGGLYLSTFPAIFDETTIPNADANKGKLYAKDKSSETIPYWRNSTAEYEVGLLGTTAAPIGADYLVGTASAGLTAEIVVGTTPGGELGGTWASPTVDATHSGSTHAGVVTTHEAASDPHTGYVLESLLDAKGDLISASAADTPIKLTVGADDTILMADAAAASGLKWVASAAPVAIGTTLAVGTSDDFARASHVHVATTLVDASAGTTRVLAASSSPHVSVTGDLDVSAHGAFGAAATVGTPQVMLLQENPTQAADWKGLYVTGTVTNASSAAARAYFGIDNIVGLSGAFAVGTYVGSRTYYEHNVAGTVTTYAGHQSLLYVGSLFGSTTAAVATTFIGSDIAVTVNPDTSTSSQTPVGTMKGQLISVNHNATANAGQTATVTAMHGLHIDVNMATSAQQRITTFTGLDIDLSGMTLGTVATGIGLRVQDYGAVTVTNEYGISIEGQTPKNWIEGGLEVGAITAATRPTTLSAQFTVSKTSTYSAVVLLRSPATNDDPILSLSQGRQTTTDATVTTIESLSTGTGYLYVIETLVLARNTGGSTAGSYKRIGTFRNDAGVVTQVGTTTSVHTNEDTAGWDVTMDISGTTIRVRVTGAAATNIVWHSHTWQSSVAT